MRKKTTIFYLVLFCVIIFNQKKICNVIDPHLASQTLSHRRNIASPCLFEIYFHGNCSGNLSSSVPQLHEFKRSTRLTVRSHNFTTEITRSKLKFSSNSFYSVFFSVAPLARGTLFRLIAFLSSMIFKDLKAMSIVTLCSFIVLTFSISLILSNPLWVYRIACREIMR